MTTYWKSQDRKYCEFCKCWFADNKVSISFHENGKKHKESVKKHISQLTKKSAKDFKQKEKIDNDIKKMEEAAMAAYLKDVQNNADLTSQEINNMLDKTGSSSSDIVASRDTTEEVMWHELKSEDGNSYYWNTLTNETSWDQPEKYLSLAEQEEKKKLKKEEDKRKKTLKKQKAKEAQEEAKAHLARESMRELSVKKDEPASDIPVTTLATYGPVTCSNPYGSWKPVEIKPVEHIDLQLPKPDKEPFVPPVTVEPERIEFREKRIESLGEGPVEFKKRKFNNPKRNIRQKFDDD